MENEHSNTDSLPASYHYHDESLGKDKPRRVANPANAVPAFLERELSLGRLDDILKHLWFAGSRHPATQLHFNVAMSREVTVADRMDLHLLWGHGKIFLKPIPRFLLDPDFWQMNLKCSDSCACENRGVAISKSDTGDQFAPKHCKKRPREVALGFLYTYACIICSESDFFVANEKRLLPRGTTDAKIEWGKWKQLAREILEKHDPNKVHPRFLRSELRLSRLNTINRFTRLPPFNPYLRGWRSYGDLFRDNLSWMATGTVFVALVLTAMQVGLATERLQGNSGFQRASYGFTVFAILGPLCAFGLLAAAALFNLVKDLPWLLRKPPHGSPPVTIQSPNSPV